MLLREGESYRLTVLALISLITAAAKNYGVYDMAGFRQLLNNTTNKSSD